MVAGPADWPRIDYDDVAPSFRYPGLSPTSGPVEVSPSSTLPLPLPLSLLLTLPLKLPLPLPLLLPLTRVAPCYAWRCAGRATCTT